jgi:hypothetical protein
MQVLKIEFSSIYKYITEYLNNVYIIFDVKFILIYDYFDVNTNLFLKSFNYNLKLFKLYLKMTKKNKKHQEKTHSNGKKCACCQKWFSSLKKKNYNAIGLDNLNELNGLRIFKYPNVKSEIQENDLVCKKCQLQANEQKKKDKKNKNKKIFSTTLFR